MIDTRNKKEFDKIKDNKDRKTLKVETYKTLPVLLRQIETQISSWVPSLHKIRQSMILFTTADEMEIKIDTSYGKGKLYSVYNVTVSG